jgi:hypothetical protein
MLATVAAYTLAEEVLCQCSRMTIDLRVLLNGRIRRRRINAAKDPCEPIEPVLKLVAGIVIRTRIHLLTPSPP